MRTTCWLRPRKRAPPRELKICLPAGHGESLEACAGDYRDWVLGFLTRSLAPASRREPARAPAGAS